MKPEPQSRTGAISRRAVLRRAIGLGSLAISGPALAACGRLDNRRWAGRFLTIATTGGAARQALWQAAISPFQQATGCQVMDLVLPVRALLAELERQELARQIQWDLIALDAPILAHLLDRRPDRFTSLPVDLRQQASLPAPLAQYGLACCADTLTLAVRSAPFANRQPASWAAAWDTTPAAFPGPRAFPRDPVGLLELALLADDVPLDQLYPLDLDRALAALSQLRPAIRLWWEETQRPGTALAFGEADLVLARGGDLRAALSGGAHASLAALPTPVLPLTLALPRDAPNVAVALDFLSHLNQPTTRASFRQQGFLPLGDTLPDLHFPLDLNWWGREGTRAQQRFADWYRQG